VPPTDLPALLPPAWTERHAPLRVAADFEPSPYISSYLWFADKITREQFWVRLWSPSTLNYDFYDLSNIRPEWAARPSVIASNIIYSHRAQQMTDDEIIDATRREISEFAPAAAHTRLRHARVHRIPMAIPCPYPGTERGRPPPRTPIRNLFLAGDWLATALPASMESAVRAGWLAAEQIWGEIGRPRRLALPASLPKGFAGLVYRCARMGH
jgi:uncharacterized protein with NAD-binding domain and iron-sulfur cluster